MEAMFGRTPRPDTLGYQAALEAGMAVAEIGATEIALPYFERAASLRPTGIALTHVGRSLRDLGRLNEAESVYRTAIDSSGSSTGHAIVGLIAVLCDLRRYEDALPLAQKAAVDHPDNPAALTVAARCLEEFVDVLDHSDRGARQQLALVRMQAAALRNRARALEPTSESERMHRRRERTFPVHSLYARPSGAPGQPDVADQSQTHVEAAPLRSPAPDGSSLETETKHAPTAGLLRRLWATLWRRG